MAVPAADVEGAPAGGGDEACCGALRRRYAAASSKWLARPDQAKSKTLADQWALHKSKRVRWISFGILGLFGGPMHVLRNIALPLSAVTVMAALSALIEYNAPNIIDPSDAFRTVFVMLSFSLSLTLAWKINRTYERWWHARCSFAGVGNGVTALMRFACTHVDDDAILDQLAVWLQSWHYAVLQLVTGKTQVTDPRVRRLMRPEELAIYDGTNKPRLLAGAAVSVLFSEAGLSPQLVQVAEELVWYTTRQYGVPVRIKLQALPIGISGFTTTLLYSVLLMLPWGMSSQVGSPIGRFSSLGWQVASTVFIAMMLLAIDDICSQYEDPFDHMPLEAIVATTARDVPRIRKEIAALRALTRQRRGEINEARRGAAAARDAGGNGGGGSAPDVAAK